METPPELPAPKPPLGTQFYAMLLAPLALTALAFCCAKNSQLAQVILELAGVAMLASSIILAGRLSRRMSKTGESSLGLGILLFFALQAFYGVCFFVGCTGTLLVS